MVSGEYSATSRPAVAAASIAFQVPVKWWQRFAPYLFIGGALLLVLVLIPGIGREVNGSRRWISLLVVKSLRMNGGGITVPAAGMLQRSGHGTLAE